MTQANWRYCYQDLAEVTSVHGKKAMRVWTDKLASNTRSGARWIESGVEPYRNAVVMAFNGPEDSIFVDRFWISLERNTAIRGWGYWLRDDLGQLGRLAENEYPTRTDDRPFLSQILFTPSRADGPLWKEDRHAVIREAAQMLEIHDLDSFWNAITEWFLPKRYTKFEIVDQTRKASARNVEDPGWSPAVDVLLDREFVEQALGFSLHDRTPFTVKKWYCSGGIHGNRFVAVKSKVSEDWFCAEVKVSKDDVKVQVEDVFNRILFSTKDLDDYTAELDVCNEKWE